MRIRVKTAVAAAAELGQIDELKRLLEECPTRANEVDELGVFPLMFAAAGGCVEAAELMLDFGADVHACNPIKWSVLLYAALNDHAAMVDFLVARGAVVSEHDLWLTAYTGNAEGLRALLANFRGDPSSVRTDESRKTLLHLAVEGLCFLKRSAEQHAACVAQLLDLVPVDAKEPRKGRTCLQDFLADVRWRTRSFENSPAHMGVLESLCLQGASVAQEDNEGNSALSLASDARLGRARELLFGYA